VKRHVKSFPARHILAWSQASGQYRTEDAVQEIPRIFCYEFVMDGLDPAVRKPAAPPLHPTPKLKLLTYTTALSYQPATQAF
jgi:hypothetical protein